MIDIINRYSRIKAERDDESLDDLGLDSIDKMSIALEIEGVTGRAVSDVEIDRWQYVGDILAMASSTENTND